MGLGSEIQDPEKNLFRIPGSKRHRIPDPQLCKVPILTICFTIFVWLVQEFGKFGTLESIKIVLDTKSGQSRGFGFITFQNLKDATKAKNALTETGQYNTQKGISGTHSLNQSVTQS